MGVTAECPCPATEQGDGSISSGSLAVLSGGGLTLWGGAAPAADTMTQCELALAPDRVAVVGRAEGREVPYLDPAYRPTRLVPGTGASVLHSGGHGTDNLVSRGHFMLRGVAGGILLVNGVPRRGGGVRPPKNGTWLLRPGRRALGAGEEYLVESGSEVVLWLPNEAVLRLAAR